MVKFNWYLPSLGSSTDPRFQKKHNVVFSCCFQQWCHISHLHAVFCSYTPQNKHETWKWSLGKGDSYWKPSFPGSMLIFRGVAKKTMHLNCRNLQELTTKRSWSHVHVSNIKRMQKKTWNKTVWSGCSILKPLNRKDFPNKNQVFNVLVQYHVIWHFFGDCKANIIPVYSHKQSESSPHMIFFYTVTLFPTRHSFWDSNLFTNNRVLFFNLKRWKTSRGSGVFQQNHVCIYIYVNMYVYIHTYIYIYIYICKISIYPSQKMHKKKRSGMQKKQASPNIWQEKKINLPQKTPPFRGANFED